jgi:hypothetical protein
MAVRRKGGKKMIGSGPPTRSCNAGFGRKCNVCVRGDRNNGGGGGVCSGSAGDKSTASGAHSQPAGISPPPRPGQASSSNNDDGHRLCHRPIPGGDRRRDSVIGFVVAIKAVVPTTTNTAQSPQRPMVSGGRSHAQDLPKEARAVHAIRCHPFR